MSTGAVGSTSPAVILPPANGPRETVISGAPGSTKTKSPFQKHYNDLLTIINEIGKDVKPAYTSNKLSTEKLRKNIVTARAILRDCQSELDRLGNASQD